MQLHWEGEKWPKNCVERLRPQSSKYDDWITNVATQNFSIGFSALFLSFPFPYPIPLDRLPRSRLSTRGRSLTPSHLPCHILSDSWSGNKRWLWRIISWSRLKQQFQPSPSQGFYSFRFTLLPGMNLEKPSSLIWQTPCRQLNYQYAGWPFTLFPTFRWHQNKISVLAWGPCTKAQPLFWCQREVGENVSLPLYDMYIQSVGLKEK